MPEYDLGSMIEGNVVRIMDRRGTSPIGVGILISDEDVLTSASVVAASFGMSAEKLDRGEDLPKELRDRELSIHHLVEGSEDVRSASLREWAPSVDMAVLKLSTPVWNRVPGPPWAIPSDSSRDYRTYGFREDMSGGYWMEGRVEGQTPEGLYRLAWDTGVKGYFGGAPVLSVELQGVIGMVAGMVHPTRGKEHPTELLMIPMNKLVAAYPLLAELVSFSGPQSQTAAHSGDVHTIEQARTVVEDMFSVLSQSHGSGQSSPEADRLLEQISLLKKDDPALGIIVDRFLKDPGSSDAQKPLGDRLAVLVLKNERLRYEIQKDTAALLKASVQKQPRAIRANLEDGAIEQKATAEKPISDISEDKLGFATYVRALRNFIASEDTTTPLTISVDGNWGAGKSSLMRMLKTELDDDKHLTIWFNAWKFDQEEKLWAALSLAVLSQIRDGLGFTKRLRFWLHLTFKRFKLWGTVWQVLKKFALPIILCLPPIVYGLAVKKESWQPSGQVPDSVNALLNTGIPYIFWVGAIITGIIQVSKLLKDPFQISVTEVLDKPNYREKIGFIGRFEEDFKRIVEVATGAASHQGSRKKLVIFIDDLDRCEPPKAADIVAAINLFLDSEGCVFVLGMDSAAVIASIETRYKDLFATIRSENVMVVSPGRLFLDKIIQIPFHIPRPTSESIQRLVSDILTSRPKKMGQQRIRLSRWRRILPVFRRNKAAPGKESLLKRPQPTKEVRKEQKVSGVDVGLYANEDVRSAITAGSELLADNPRQVKRFINLFRLNAYIADQRGLLRKNENGEIIPGITLDILGSWVAWSIRWPSLIKHLADETSLPGLRAFLSDTAQRLDDDGKWTEEQKAMSVEQVNQRRVLPQMQKAAHWCHLPWEWWLEEVDFCLATKKLEWLWIKPEPEETDWLVAMLSMSELTLPSHSKPPEPPEIPTERGARISSVKE